MPALVKHMLWLYLLLLASWLRAQPTCGTSFLQLTAYEFSPTGGITITIGVTPAESVGEYNILHRFQLGDELIEETLTAPDLSLTLTLDPEAALHEFTALSTCEDGTMTEGSTFFLDLAGASLDCPPPTNLVIEFVNIFSAGFRWQGNAQADRYEVRYTPQGVPTLISETPVPSFVQELLPASLHTFEIRSVCPAPGITNAIDQYSPALRFSIVTVDDIKAFRLSCAEMEVVTDTAYQLQCTKHGDFGANKDSFLLVHQNVCLNALQEPVFLATEISPNPTDNVLNISYQLLQAGLVWGELLSTNGELIRTWLSPNWQHPGIYNYDITLNKLPPGIYLLRLYAKDQILTRKIIKMP